MEFLLLGVRSRVTRNQAKCVSDAARLCSSVPLAASRRCHLELLTPRVLLLDLGDAGDLGLLLKEFTAYRIGLGSVLPTAAVLA